MMESIELQQLRTLYELSFPDRKEYVDYFFANKATENNVVCRKLNGKIVSALYLVEKTVALRGARFRCPFIVAAATLPELRGKKLLEGVMGDAFLRIASAGRCFTILSPFRHEYYRKYGFETYAYVDSFVVNGMGNAGVTARLASVRDLPAIKRVYDTFTAGKQGVVLRSEAVFSSQYEEWSADCCKVFLLQKNGETCGYLVVNDEGVQEFCADPQDLNGMQGLKGLKVELQHGEKEGNMARVVCPQPLLENIVYDGDGTVCFRLLESFLPENSGTYLLQVKNRLGKLQRVQQAPDCVITAGEFVRIIFGAAENPAFRKILRKKETMCFDKF